MIIGYATISLTPENYSWAVHCYIGKPSEKGYTALQGQCFTTAGYMPRKSQIALHKAGIDVVSSKEPKLSSEDPNVKKLVAEGNPWDGSVEEVLEQDKPLLYRNEYLVTTGHVIPDGDEIEPVTLLEPMAIYNVAMSGDRENYPGYAELWKVIMKQIHSKFGEEELVLVSNEKLKKIDPIPGLKLYDGSAGVMVAPGFLEASVLLRTVTNVDTPDLFELKADFNPHRFSEYWKPVKERNPLMYQRYMIHDSIAPRKHYTTFDDKLISDFGKRANSVSYAIVKPKERDPILDRLMAQEIESKLEPTTHYILIGNVYKPLVNSALGKYGTAVLLPNGFERKYADDIPICGTYPSPGLSQRGHEYHRNMEAIFLRYLDGNVFDDLEILDITDSFYDTIDGKLKVKPGIEKNGGLVKCPSPGAHKGFQFLVLGKDLPPRNSLNRLTGDVKIQLYSSKDLNIVRYGVIISSNEGDAIFSYYNCNVRFVQLGGK